MGGFEVLKGVIDFNRSQSEAYVEDIANNECPYCWWPLDINEANEKSCKMCGRIY